MSRRIARRTRQMAGYPAKAALRVAMSPAALRSGLVVRLWTAAISSGRLPQRGRARLSLLLHSSLLRADRPEQANRTLDAALNRMHDRRLRAHLLLRRASAELPSGTPACLPAAATAHLELADDSLARHDVRDAVASVQVAQRLLFDRRLHFDRMSSPMADDPVRFLAPWHASQAVRALSAPRGRREPVRPAAAGRGVRLLLVTYGNHGFIDLIRRHFEKMPGVDLRFWDPGEEDPGREGQSVSLMSQPQRMMEHILAGRSGYGERVAQWLAPHLEWADVVFIDWCAALAVLFTMIDPGSARLVIRMHSFEAFAIWPHLVDFSRADDVIFVSDHLRGLATAVAPHLITSGPALHVVSNAMDLAAFRRDKQPDARFTLGVVGIKAVAKDPRWAVEVLRRLRQQDPRYRLVVFGQDLNPDVSADARRYWDLFLADVAELAGSGAMIRMGHVDDMPEALTQVGVIVSSSVRESFHCALVEGAASGAVPVVRDWPFFAGAGGGARSLFPADWVVDSAAAAADRILTVTASEETWRQAGKSASAHAIASWDWEITKHQYERVILGPAAMPEPHKVEPGGAAT